MFCVCHWTFLQHTTSSKLLVVQPKAVISQTVILDIYRKGKILPFCSSCYFDFHNGHTSMYALMTPMTSFLLCNSPVPPSRFSPSSQFSTHWIHVGCLHVRGRRTIFWIMCSLLEAVSCKKDEVPISHLFLFSDNMDGRGHCWSRSLHCLLLAREINTY